MLTDDRLLNLAAELQSIAQAGLFYTKDDFDRERFGRVREIAAELMSEKTALSLERVHELFCSETGYQTPKLATRAALFRDERILLVRERDGNWSLPGGWCEANLSLADSCVKEVFEESGLVSEPVKLIAVQANAKNNPPKSLHPCTSVFIECRELGGSFRANSETTAADFFPADSLPPLSAFRNTEKQVLMCFAAHRDRLWQATVD